MHNYLMASFQAPISNDQNARIRTSATPQTISSSPSDTAAVIYFRSQTPARTRPDHAGPSAPVGNRLLPESRFSLWRRVTRLTALKLSRPCLNPEPQRTSIGTAVPNWKPPWPHRKEYALSCRLKASRSREKVTPRYRYR